MQRMDPAALLRAWESGRREFRDLDLRGARLSEVELYEAHHYCRFDVKPGITGPWQVNGRNGITDFEKVIRLEREYIQSWSLLKDMGILIATMPALLRGNGRGVAWS